MVWANSSRTKLGEDHPCDPWEDFISSKRSTRPERRCAGGIWSSSLCGSMGSYKILLESHGPCAKSSCMRETSHSCADISGALQSRCIQVRTAAFQMSCRVTTVEGAVMPSSIFCVFGKCTGTLVLDLVYSCR